MSETNDRVDDHRRRILQTTGALAGTSIAALAGCSGGGGGGGGGGGSTPTASPTSTVTEAKQTTQNPEKAKYGGEVVYSASDDSQKLDPHYGVTKASSQLLVHVFEFPFKINNKLEPEPYLVKDWSVSEDKTSYTLNIHEGVMFHPPVDRELIADDVVASLERIKNDKSASAHSDVKRIQEFEVVDDYTLKFHLDKPFAPIRIILADTDTAILPRDYFDKMSKDPVGSGPFKFEKRQRGNFSLLTKFEDYHREKYPYFDSVRSTPISDGSVRLQELQTGNVHIATQIASKDVSKVKKADDLSLEPVKGLAVEEFAFNNEVKPFDDPKVRRAIAYAMDMDKLIAFALNGLGQKAITPLPPQSPYALEGEPLPQDFEKAKSLLADAGHGDGFKSTIKLPNSYPRSVKIGTPVQQWLKQIGIEAELQRVTWDTWISDVFAKGNYEMTTVPFYGAFNPHTALYKIFHTGETFNFFNYSNEKVDKLLEKGAKLTKQEERMPHYKEAQRIIRKDLPIVLPFYRDQLYARRKVVKNRLNWGTGGMRLWRNWFGEK